MATFKVECPNCGASVEKKNEKGMFCCEYCETKFYASDPSTIRIVDEAKILEVELEREKFRAQQERYEKEYSRNKNREDTTYSQEKKNAEYRVVDDDGRADDEEYNEWKKRSIITIVGSLFLTSIFSDIIPGFSLLFIAAVIYAITTNPRKGEKNSSSSRSSYQSTYAETHRNYDHRPELPWYHKAWAIFLFGCITGGLYWLIGPFLRMKWKKDNWY